MPGGTKTSFHLFLHVVLYPAKQGGRNIDQTGSDWHQMGQIGDFLRSEIIYFSSVSSNIVTAGSIHPNYVSQNIVMTYLKKSPFSSPTYYVTHFGLVKIGHP